MKPFFKRALKSPLWRPSADCLIATVLKMLAQEKTVPEKGRPARALRQYSPISPQQPAPKTAFSFWIQSAPYKQGASHY